MLLQFDCIHLHGFRGFQNIIVARYAKKFNVPYILQVHGSLSRGAVKRRLELLYDIMFGFKLLRETSRAIALSQIEAERYKSMGVPEDKIAIIPNGIDLSEYAKNLRRTLTCCT